MKKALSFAVALFLSLSVSATSQNNEKKSFNYSGSIAKMIIAAMEAAGVKAECDKYSCKYMVTDFYAAEETDGCGGGTTSHDTSFTYSDATKFSFKYCEGYDGRSFRDGNNRASALVTVIEELDFFTTSGWTSSASLDVIDCRAEAQSSYAACTIKEKN